jgi:hypothetical protein
LNHQKKLLMNMQQRRFQKHSADLHFFPTQQNNMMLKILIFAYRGTSWNQWSVWKIPKTWLHIETDMSRGGEYWESSVHILVPESANDQLWFTSRSEC